MQLLDTLVEVNDPVDHRRTSWDCVALPHLRNHTLIQQSTTGTALKCYQANDDMN